MNNFIKILSNNEKHAVDEEIQSVVKYLDDKSIYNGIMLQNLCRDEQSTIEVKDSLYLVKMINIGQLLKILLIIKQ